VLCYLAAMALGLVSRMPGVSVVPGRAISLAGSGIWPLQIDGEIVTGGPLSVTLAEEPLSILQPGSARSP
jgi:hypothetical protein